MDLRHEQSSINGMGSKLKWQNLVGLFLIEFLLSQLVFSYGIYTNDIVQRNMSIIDALWPPLILLVSWKVVNPLYRDVAESYHENYFRPLFFTGILICSIGLFACFFFSSGFIQALLYGGLGGIGTSLTLCLIQCHLYDIFPYQSTLVLGVQHFSVALGLFITPHMIQFLFDSFMTRNNVFLIHSAMLLHAIPAGLLLGKKKLPVAQRLTAYSNLGSNDAYNEEMIEMSSIERQLNLFSSRNWKSPSDNANAANAETDDISNETSLQCQNRNSLGVDILPQILEENEDDSDDDLCNKRNGMLNDNLKRMSVISSKLEELIIRDEENHDTPQNNQNEIVLDVHRSEENGEIRPDILYTNSFTNVFESHRSSCCCSPYQRYRYRRRLKYCFDAITDMTIRPMISSLRIVEFYPSLLTNIHSMLSPLIFLNFITYKANHAKDIYMTEITFMFSIIAFAYHIFLITLPWVTEISKRNLKYLYIFGSLLSGFGIYLFKYTQINDYMTVSCLVYGFGLGIESYCKEYVLKESLGVTKWSKVEGTLECLSGILLMGIVVSVKELCSSYVTLREFITIWFDIIFWSHMIIASIWIIVPCLIYLFKCIFNRNRDSYSFANANDT